MATQLIYKRLLEVKIQHDYFLIPAAGGGVELPGSYNVRDFLDIKPSGQTALFMQNHHILFRRSATGFVLFTESEFINGPNTYASKLNMDPGAKLSFYWSLKDPAFLNYTNQRINEEERKIYFFNNKDATLQAGIRYLNNAVVSFGTSYLNEPAYQLGDMVIQDSKTYEMTDKDAPLLDFVTNQAKWQEIAGTVINYVNPQDRVRWQFPAFTHTRQNTNPGELIRYTLKDINNQPVELGLIPGTSSPVNSYQTSADASQGVNYSLDLSKFYPGKYFLDIDEAGGTTTLSFYLLNPQRQEDVFAVAEFFVTVPDAQFQFIQKDAATKRWLLDDPHKVFLVRFRNRSTRWRYLNQDNSVFDEPPSVRPLTKTYSGYQKNVSGTLVNLPDPLPGSIDPDIETGTNLIKNIYSKIYLIK